MTSPDVVQGVFPEIKSMVDDFIHLLCQARNKNNIVKGFEGLSNRMGLESKCDRTILLADVNRVVIFVLIP